MVPVFGAGIDPIIHDKNSGTKASGGWLDGWMVVCDCTGEPDVNIFVVQSGRLDVTTTDAQGITHIFHNRVGDSHWVQFGSGSSILGTGFSEYFFDNKNCNLLITRD
jgi:hypothetical protein